jgi:hypothetical protein
LNIARIRALLALALRANVRISEINASCLGRRAWNIAIMVFGESTPVTEKPRSMRYAAIG